MVSKAPRRFMGSSCQKFESKVQHYSGNLSRNMTSRSKLALRSWAFVYPKLVLARGDAAGAIFGQSGRYFRWNSTFKWLKQGF